MNDFENYKMIAENISDLISRHTLEGKFTYLSPSCHRILGYRPDELVGSNPYDLYHPEDIDTYYAEAPEIVKKLEKLPTPEFIFDRMYSSYILPAIEHIEEGNNAAAYRIYKMLFKFCEAL